MGKKGHGAIYDSPEIDAHEPFKVFEGNGFKKIADRYTGIVDDKVHTAVAFGRLIGIPEDLFTLRHVQNMGCYFHTVADEFCGFLQGRGIDVRKCQAASFFCQVDGKHPANTRGRAGNGCSLVFENLHFCSFPGCIYVLQP